MSKKLTTEQFIKKALAVHKNKYDYSEVDYINAKEKVKIKCKKHGMFLQNPSSHLAGSGCRKCAVEIQHNKQKHSHKQFVEKLFTINKDLKVISKYKGIGKTIIVRDQYGIDYHSFPNNLLKGKTPSIVTALDKDKTFKVKASIAHNNKYTYTKAIYIKDNVNIIITCPIHGDFNQTPSNHLNGRGCKKCNRNYGYRRSYWVNFCNNKKDSKPRVYLIRCYNDEENFIKIGITTKEINQRFHNNYKFPYKFEIIKEYFNTPVNTWNLEKELHRSLYKFKYKPLKKFGGDNECFNIKALDAEILKTFIIS